MNLLWCSTLLLLRSDGVFVEPANIPSKFSSNQTSTNNTVPSPSPSWIITTVNTSRDTVANPDVTEKPTDEEIPVVHTVVPLLVALMVAIAIGVAVYRQSRSRNRSATEIDEKELVPENNQNRSLKFLRRKPSQNVGAKMDTITEENTTQMEPRFAQEDGDLGLGSNGQMYSHNFKGVEVRQPSRTVIDLTPLHNSVVGGSPRSQPKLDKPAKNSAGTNGSQNKVT